MAWSSSTLVLNYASFSSPELAELGTHFGPFSASARLYRLTEDAGVRDMFSFLLARDTMHQNQWLAAIEDLKAEGLEDTPVPSNFPQEREMSEVAYKFMNFSEGEESREGRWAQGPSVDGKGEFE